MMEPPKNRWRDFDRIVTWLSRGGVKGAVLIEHLTDDTLCQPNEPADSVFYLQRGQVRVHHFSAEGTERFTSILGSGAWVGMAALARKPRYIIRARVIAESLVWQMPAPGLFDALARTPEIAATVVTQLAERLLDSHEAATRLVFHGCDRRLVQTLLDFSNSAAAMAQSGGIALQITHTELAQAVGAARETVSHAMNALRARHLIQTSRNRVTFNPQALREFARAQARGHSAQT